METTAQQYSSARSRKGCSFVPYAYLYIISTQYRMADATMLGTTSPRLGTRWEFSFPTSFTPHEMQPASCEPCQRKIKTKNKTNAPHFDPFQAFPCAWYSCSRALCSMAEAEYYGPSYLAVTRPCANVRIPARVQRLW